MRHEDLVRGIGVRQLAASIVNSTIGAGIFVLPALAAQGLGAAAPLAYIGCALLMTLVVTTFAMAGSRVSTTGGLLAYVETAFGPYAGFLAGTLLWMTAVLAAGGVSIALLEASTGVVPLLAAPGARGVALALMLAGFAAINVRGVRRGARTIELLTGAKLIPLLFFVVIGLFAIDPGALAWPGVPEPSALGRSVLLLIFAFMGIEIALTPSGEVRAPAVTVPRAIYLALATTTTLYVAVQLVAQGVLAGQLAGSGGAPLAAAATRFMGAAGTAVMLGGTLVSMLGYVSGDSLCSPRSLYAFGRDGILPAAFARVHPVHRTPYLAIWTHAAFVFVVASTGTFASIALITNVAALTLYLMACAASLTLLRRDVRAGGVPFVPRGGAAVPIAAIAAILVLMASATLKEFAATAATVLAASLLYVWRMRRQRTEQTVLANAGAGQVQQAREAGHVGSP